MLVGDLRVLAYIDAVVDYRTEMFGKVPVNLRRNNGNGLVHKNFNVGSCLLRPTCTLVEDHHSCGGGRRSFEKVPPFHFFAPWLVITTTVSRFEFRQS